MRYNTDTDWLGVLAGLKRKEAPKLLFRYKIDDLVRFQHCPDDKYCGNLIDSGLIVEQYIINSSQLKYIIITDMHPDGRVMVYEDQIIEVLDKSTRRTSYDNDKDNLIEILSELHTEPLLGHNPDSPVEVSNEMTLGQYLEAIDNELGFADADVINKKVSDSIMNVKLMDLFKMCEIKGGNEGGELPQGVVCIKEIEKLSNYFLRNADLIRDGSAVENAMRIYDEIRTDNGFSEFTDTIKNAEKRGIYMVWRPQIRRKNDLV